VRYEGGLERLLARAAGRYRMETPDPARARDVCLAAPGVHDVELDGRTLHFAAERDDVAALSVALGRAGVGIHALLPGAASLEQLYFDIVEDGRP
jgi:hypothetical protein